MSKWKGRRSAARMALDPTELPSRVEVAAESIEFWSGIRTRGDVGRERRVRAPNSVSLD